MFKVVILLLILILASPKTKTNNKKNPVFSVQNISISLNQPKLFVFKNIDESRALMINVEMQKQPTKFKEFQVAITDNNNKSTLCYFKYMNNLCVEQKPSQQVKVTITCLSDNCDFKLAFSQRSIIRSGDSTNFKKRLNNGEIYQLSKRKFNTILEIFAERDEYQVLSKQITVYSNIHAFQLSQAEELDANSAIYGLKPVRQNQDQYIYIHSTSKKSESFKIWLRSHKGQLRDSISIIDFIQTYGKRSGSKYIYVGEFKKNIQINVRVFSPKDPKLIPLTLKVLGKTSEQQQIRKMEFDSIDFEGQSIFDFSYAITHKVHSPYKTIAFEIFIGEVIDKSIFFEIEVRDVESFQVNIFDHIYFGSQAKEELQFTVQPQVKMQLADGDKDIQIATIAQEKYFSNIQTCSLHKGCNIQIKTEKQCSNCSFKFNLKDQDIKNHIIYYQVQNNAIQGKIQIAQQIYFKYAMNGKAATQIIVNSKNVILYANFDNYKRCKVPKASCHQYAINQENPMIVFNLEQKPAQLIITVMGLEKTSFKARFINQINGLQVKLGQKFSYLMDNEEKNLQLRMQIKPEDFRDSKHLHFNLISPIHSLRMKVQNGQQKIKSVEGYITFDKQDIVGDLFVINIEKINLYYDQFVHFTLIVTTSDIPVKLDSTSTHYEQYNPKSQKKFIIQYEPSISNAINIYTQNLQKEKTSMVIHIVNSKDIEGEQVKPIFSKQLVRDYEFIDLDSELEDLQICDDSNCELEIWIKNEGNSTLEQSITILQEQSVIGLDDSIWSVFQINELSKNNHFYFIPRKQNKSITVLFNTDDANLFINYRIYNSKNSINPSDWPFGHDETDQKHTANTQQVIIQANDPEILACWPTCVILININQINNQGKSDNSVIKSYKILATNSIIQLPQDTKLDFTLRSQEQKVLFIVAKGIIMYSKLTFFTYYSFGRAKITANLTSGDRQFKIQNFSFKDLQTVLQISQIKALIAKQQLKIENVLIKISIRAETNLKMTLEYSSLIKDIYRLRMDDLEVAALAKGDQIWYEFVPERDFSLKLYRVKGFPLFKIIRCNDSDYIACLNKNKNYIQMKTKQFVNQQDQIKANLEKEIVTNLQSKNQKPYLEVFVQKAYEYSDEQCERCIFFLWVYCFEGDLEMTINLRTKLSEIQLKQMSILNDRIQSGQHNRYLINIPHDKDALVTLRILQGTARVSIVKNSLSIYNETHQNQNNLVQVTINAEQQQEQEQEDEKQSAKQKQHHFGKVRKFNDQHLFGHAHVTVTTLSQLPVQLLISYSVGGSSVYLEDGIVVQKQMVPNVKHTFFYRNRNKKNKAYLTLSSQIQSFENVSISKELSIKFYYYPDAFNREIKQTFKPELPPNRNENYLGSTISHVYELPGKYELYEIKIESQSFMKITASINHEQVVYLPLGFDYLIKLHPKQGLNLVVDSPATQFLEVVVKKCDSTVPTLLYTNDAREFKKGIFEAEVQIDNNIYKQFIATKKNSSTIHLKFQANALTESLFTVSVSSSSREMRENMVNFKPGNKGIVTYKMIDIDTVQVSFKPVLCNDKECQVPFVYYLLVAQNIEQIYTDLNCANTYFVPMAQTLMNQGKKEIRVIDDKHYDKKKSEYRYRVKIQKQSAFIGIKGMIDQTTQEVQYTPLQIRSFWGELANMSFGIILTVSLILALLVTVVIVVSTKLARRGYKPISGDE